MLKAGQWNHPPVLEGSSKCHACLKIEHFESRAQKANPMPTPFTHILLHTHTYTHSHTRTHTQSNMHTHTYTIKHAYTHTHTCTHIGANTQTNIDTHTNRHTHKHRDTHTHKHTHRETQTRTHTQTHTHTHTYYIYSINNAQILNCCSVCFVPGCDVIPAGPPLSSLHRALCAGAGGRGGGAEPAAASAAGESASVTRTPVKKSQIRPASITHIRRILKRLTKRMLCNGKK